MHAILQPYLQNELVALEPLKVGDFKDLHRAASDPLIWEQHPDTERYTFAGFSKYFEEAIASKAAIKITRKENNEVIGSSRYRLIDQEQSVVEIGWTFIERKYWGGSYNRSIKKLMINYALSHFAKVVFLSLIHI